jgi:GTPase
LESQVDASPRLPRIAIVGRPNVGKSTLFNRLLGRRRAITDATPGVTRDPVEARLSVGRTTLELVDTGGYTTDSDDLSRLISARALSAIESADVILFMIDATSVTALDEEYLEVLRGHADRIILVANKLDTPARDDLVWDLYSLGISTVVGVSSAHGRGIEELLDAVLELLPEPGTEGGGGLSAIPRLAVLGQPNTGKSTLVNRLTASERSMVSPVPGTTRDVIEGRFIHEEQEYEILDTAGIRRKNKVHENIEYYSVTRAIDTIEQADVVVLLVDAEKGLTDQDKKIASLVVDRGRGLILGLNKWDLLPRVANQYEAICDRIRFLFPVASFAPIIALSAQTGMGVDTLMKEVFHVRNQLTHRVETGILNRHFSEWVERTPPPVVGHRGRPKLRYITQVQTLPITFVCFVNRKKSIPDSYVSYLRNQIRKDFGMTKVPFKLELRER